MHPLIYIHRGYSWYAPVAWRNGRRFAHGPVYLIGDRFGRFVAKACGVSAWPLEEFAGTAKRFAPLYRHYSDHGREFELFCIQRWFILSDFLLANSLESCVYLDTDVLITPDFSREVQRTSQYGLVYTGYSAHVCVVNRTASLKAFCEWVMALYADPASERRMQEWKNHMAEKYGFGGVSDMTLFYWFQKEHPELLGDYDSIFGVSPVDVSLEEVRGYQKTPDGFKKLVWERQAPSALLEDGTRVNLIALHHQGKAKQMLTGNARRLGEGILGSGIVPKVIDLFFRLFGWVGRRLRGRSQCPS